MQRLDRALDVGLDDQAKLLDVSGLHERLKLIEPSKTARRAGHRLPTRLLPGPRDLLRFALIGDLVEQVARGRKLGKTEHLDRRGRAGGRQLLASIVGHRADATPGSTGDDVVARIQGTVCESIR